MEKGGLSRKDFESFKSLKFPFNITVILGCEFKLISALNRAKNWNSFKRMLISDQNRFDWHSFIQ